MVDGYPRRVWRDSGGGEVIEEFKIPNIGHGAPLWAGGDDGYGASEDYMLEVGICSTKHIVSFWGLSDRRNRTKKTVLTAISRGYPEAVFLGHPVMPPTLNRGRLAKNDAR